MFHSWPKHGAGDWIFDGSVAVVSLAGVIIAIALLASPAGAVPGQPPVRPGGRPAAIRLGDQKVPLQLIMAKTRHKSPRTATRYVKPGDAAIAEVAGLLGPPRRTH